MKSLKPCYSAHWLPTRTCNGLNVCGPSRLKHWKPNTPSGGLWEGMRSCGWSSHEWGQCLIRQNSRGPSPSHHVKHRWLGKNSLLWTRKMVFQRRPHWCHDPGLPESGCCSVSRSCLILQPHGLRHSRPPCHSPSPRVDSNSCPSSQWCHPTISSSVIPFSSYLQSFPASGSFQMSQFFTSGGQSIAVSASASVLPMNIQGWFPLG